MFVALDLPEAPRARIAAWRDEILGTRDELRPAAVETLHVTLAFLGWQREEDAVRIATAGFGAAAGVAVPRLAPTELRPVPPRGSPRLFALDLDDSDGACTALQAAVAAALEQGGFYTPERRPFWPHVTLARVKRGARVRHLDPGPPPPAEEFSASGLTLYRSTLRPQGALYEPLARARVGEPYG